MTIGSDLNGYIDINRDWLERVHGGWGVGERNEGGESLVDFALSFDLAICNIYFQKRERQYKT